MLMAHGAPIVTTVKLLSVRECALSPVLGNHHQSAPGDVLMVEVHHDGISDEDAAANDDQ